MKALRKLQFKQSPEGKQLKNSVFSYDQFAKINGEHDFKTAVPGAYVDYPARRRHGGKVFYFNYALAKEMGMIPKDHPHEMNGELEKALLDIFAIQIINEYDVIHKTPIPKKDILPRRYMATRYLQLQHPDKNGTTSGDGRSVWNGQWTGKGSTWDISSCGTGATCLSPATAIEKKFFKTGTTIASYGCGSSDVSEGLAAALMSEIFYKNGLATERTLAIVEFERGQSINVRAGKCLLRPSHFFNHLKQGNSTRLKQAFDFFIERQIQNGGLKKSSSKNQQYKDAVNQISRDFARAAARFESDYVFVWMDWDGDNILMNGGIIDYGSVRQFGLFHHEYRYDDVQRWSTNLLEQKGKARETIETFIQLRDFILTGEKKSRKQNKKDEALSIFDAEFKDYMQRGLLTKIGFSKDQIELLLSQKSRLSKNFQKSFQHFERMKSAKGLYKVSDGITWDAIFCMRDILRELPFFVLSQNKLPSTEEFLNMIFSSYASKKDRMLALSRKKHVRDFLEHYMQMIVAVAQEEKKTLENVLLEVGMRSSFLNQKDRITGDSVLVVTQKILAMKRKMPRTKMQAIIEDFIRSQSQSQEGSRARISLQSTKNSTGEANALRSMLRIVSEHREGI